MRLRQFGLFALLAHGVGGPAATREPRDFYGWLTEAFLSGQTYLKVAPDPALRELPNPWAGAQGIPRLHDASYFHDRYYVYFGPAPVLLLFLPWRLATGTYLAEHIGTAVFGAAGTVLAGALLGWAWRRGRGGLKPAWFAVGLVLMTLGSRALLLAEDPSVYMVPINCAFCCLMAALGAAAWAMTGASPRAPALGLGLASFAWGLAVASRPDYLPGLAALLVPLTGLIRRRRRDPAGISGGAVVLVASALAPAAAIGIGLAAYNHARFGDFLQFGMKYQFTAGDQRGVALLDPGSFGFNLGRYFLTRPSYSPYFPFLVSEVDRGLLVCTPFALLAAALPFVLRLRENKVGAAPRGWGMPEGALDGLALSAGIALALTLGTLCLLAISNDRYFVDFLPAALLLAVISSWRLLAAADRASRVAGLAARILVGGGALWTAGQAGLMGLRDYRDRAALVPLARLADRAVARVEGWRGTGYGPVTLRIRFPERPAGTREPLLVSGHGDDLLYVEYLGGSRIRLAEFHAGAGGPVSEPLAVPPGLHELRVDLGSLYPPKDHPAMAAYPEPLAEVLGRRIAVALDGRIVLQGAGEFYPSDPADLQLGRNPGGIVAPGVFSGELRVVARGGVPPPDSLRGPPGEGAVRLTVTFPRFEFYRHDPLLSTGHRGAGDLLYVVYVAPGLVRLGHDSWGGGAVETAPLACDPGQPQIIEADLASLRPLPSGRTWAPLALRFNHRLVMFQRRPFNPSLPAEVVMGFNGCAATSAPPTFSGRILAVERIAPIPGPALEEGIGPAPPPRP
jgi:hypothetical protein